MDWTARTLSEALEGYLAKVTQGQTSHEAVRPQDYTPWKWPPHAISFDYPIHKEHWIYQATLEVRGIQFPVEVAPTEFGVFGRCGELLHEAKGRNLEDMLYHLGLLAEPLLKRQEMIAATLGREGRYTEPLRQLDGLGWLQLLFAPDRAIARDAQAEIEANGPGLQIGRAHV